MTEPNDKNQTLLVQKIPTGWSQTRWPICGGFEPGTTENSGRDLKSVSSVGRAAVC